MAKNLSKNQKGAIGEHLVAAKLLEKGLDVFMANMSINNSKAYDILAVEPDNLKTYFIQVKFNSTKYFNAEMSIAQARNKDFLKEHIVGPWIFVDGSDSSNYEYYVLTADEVIELLYHAHEWYWTKYNRKKEISDKSPAGFKLSWLKGEPEKATTYHEVFINPIANAKDCWDKICS